MGFLLSKLLPLFLYPLGLGLLLQESRQTLALEHPPYLLSSPSQVWQGRLRARRQT
jgi:hypothetical protein